MTDQPPGQPTHGPSGHSVGDNAATRPLPAAGSSAAASSATGSPATGSPAAGSSAAGSPATGSSSPPTTNVWRQATSTTGGRWAVAVAAGALACLLLLGVVVAGVVVLRGHDRVSLLGQQQEGYSRDQGDQGRQGNGQGPGARSRNGPQQPGMPGAPGFRGGGEQGLGGLGGLLGGGALHGSVTATVNGSVQALVFQRGAVTAVSATSITLKSTDGFVGTYGVTAATGSRMGTPVKGGQAFVLARASDKVAITMLATATGTDSSQTN